MIKKILFFTLFFLFFNQLNAKENIMIMKLKDGEVVTYIKDIHPNKLGHEQIAEILYNAYEQIYKVS